jgi:UDP-glucose 4-epimerase
VTTPPQATATRPAPPRAVLVTGAAGYIGGLVVKALAADPRTIETLVATDLRIPPGGARGANVIWEAADLRTCQVADLIARHAIDTVIHLAAIVKPPKVGGRELAFEVDVRGTERVLEACVAHGVAQIVITSSGAAYGYYADSPPLLTEDDPIRGNEVFAYSHHKKLVEEMLARYRAEHPALTQLILRPGTVLGAGVSNQITAIFERPVVLGLRDVATPFVFIWDEDVAAIVGKGVHERRAGIYNLAGDGVMTLREIAARLGKPYLAVPVPWLRRGLTVLHRLGVSPYGPEQVIFLQYRPVLGNERLKHEFGYLPKTSRDTFEIYRTTHGTI